MESYLTVTCASFFISEHKENYPNSEKRGFTVKRLSYEEFLICISFLAKYKLFKLLFAITFPKIDKDLKTGF